MKRLVVWSLERFVEAFLLAGLLGLLAYRVAHDSVLLIDFWVFALPVAAILFLHGYYITTAFFGVIWRSAKPWLYPAIVAGLFMIHAHIIFARGKPDFSTEARAMELPFLLGGACIVFACSFAGSAVLNKWVQPGSGATPYLSATGITLLVFTLANVYDSLRVTYTDAFPPHGVPFTFYREGGFVGQWVWHSGKFVWRGMIADAVLVAGIILLLGKAWQRIGAARVDR